MQYRARAGHGAGETWKLLWTERKGVPMSHPGAFCRPHLHQSPCSMLHTLSGFSDAVNGAQIPYNPFTTNSDAFAHQAVTYLGIPRPAPPLWIRPFTLGWNTHLVVGSFGSI